MPGALFLFVHHSSGVTGGVAGAGAAAGGAVFWTGSTVPAASCGAAAGRLRGTGVAVADFVAGFGATAGGGTGLCGVTAAERGAGAIACGGTRAPMIEPGRANSISSSDGNGG
jgi:hypothetical protein